MDPVEVGRKALEYDKYSGCCQSVLLALQEALGLGNEESFKAATVLAGGVARRGETCGAVLGALMALGLAEGRERMENIEDYRRALGLSQSLIEGIQKALQERFDFQKPLESTLCTDIQERVYGRSFDLTTQEGYQAFLDAGGHSDQGCPLVCAVAAEVAARYIAGLG